MPKCVYSGYDLCHQFSKILMVKPGLNLSVGACTSDLVTIGQ